MQILLGLGNYENLLFAQCILPFPKKGPTRGEELNLTADRFKNPMEKSYRMVYCTFLNTHFKKDKSCGGGKCTTIPVTLLT